MISPDAKLSIQRVPLERLQVKEYQARYPGRLLHYIGLLTDNPGMYAGLLYATPSDTHPGMLTILDGHHKFAAAIIAGRPDVLCVVEESPALEVLSESELERRLREAGQRIDWRSLEISVWPKTGPQTGPLEHPQD
jgi:hypothetical protein